MNHQPPAGIHKSLSKIVTGTGIVFLGTTLSLALALLGRLIVARMGTEAEYGVFALAFVIVNICATITTLGFQEGLPRSIAVARAKNENSMVKAFALSGLQLCMTISTLLGVTVFFASDFIATTVFNDSALGIPLKISAFAIPLFNLLKILGSIFRGVDDVKPQLFFHDILRNALFPLILVPIIVLGFCFDTVFYAFLASFAVSGLAFIGYAFRHHMPIHRNQITRLNPAAKEMLLFSLPLMGVTMFELMLSWTDTLMLGGFKSSNEVGLYNVAYPIAVFIAFPVVAMGQIYVPVASGLYSKGSMRELKRNFSITTKWVSLATLPLFLILFLFPETVLTFLFGSNYAEASSTLRILSVGFMIRNLFGPNGAFLIAIGKSQFMMWVTLAAAILNVILNVLLIPPFGIEGAAIASVSTIAFINVTKCSKLYLLSRSQPLSKNQLKPILASLLAIPLIYYLVTDIMEIVWWTLPFIVILFYSIVGASTLLTRSVDEEDMALFTIIGEKVRYSFNRNSESDTGK